MINKNKSKIKVLVVDDSAMVRKIFSSELSKTGEIEIVGTAPDPYVARDKILQLNPDVLVLDIEMPKMDGLTFLEKLMRHYPMPVVIVSSLAKEGGETALRAIELGALEIMAKPGTSFSVGEMSGQLIEKIKAVHNAKIPVAQKSQKMLSQSNAQFIKPVLKTTNKVIAIGASTGGTEAIKNILTGLPPMMPPIIIVQHMPENFTRSFAERLNTITHHTVKEAENNEILSPGKVLIARGNKHLVLRRSGATYYVEVKDGEMVYHQRPSIEIMFHSVARYAASNAVGVILTGMGKDGAGGLLEMKNSGAYTIGQDEKSCVVYGMPKEAARLGAIMKVAPLDRIPNEIIESCQ